MSIYFITGTDTGVGKTRFTCAFIHGLQTAGFYVDAFKPIASGAAGSPPYAHEDSVAIARALAQPTPLDSISPWVYSAYASPNIAADEPPRAKDVARHCQPRVDTANRITVIEGAGGWLCPINNNETFADVARLLNAKIILVVGMRLGCMSHTLLSMATISQTNRCVGWVANAIDREMPYQNENINTIKAFSTVPLIAQLPYQTSFDPKLASRVIRLEALPTLTSAPSHV